jgi:PadR family transcriptional regulator PadR
MSQKFAAAVSASPRASQRTPSVAGNEEYRLFEFYFLWTGQMCRDIFFAMAKGAILSADKSEVLQGTLDMMILKTLHVLGPLHGFGIARRIEQVSEDVLTLNEGTVYTSLLRLQQQGWIKSEWGTSENNRRARFYSITRQGRKQLAVETANWERISGVIGRVLRLEAQK